MDYSGEAVTSFVYDGSTDLSFSMKNNGQNTMGYSVKGPNTELIVGGYIKPGEQQINVTNVRNALSPLPMEHIKFTFQMMMVLRGNSSFSKIYELNLKRFVFKLI